MKRAIDIFEETTEKISSGGSRPGLLLHVCCAPCLTSVSERLKEYFDITAFFYNPNIMPEEEYFRRLNETENFIKEALPGVDIIKGDYAHDDYRAAVAGRENDPERGTRCRICINLRMEETAKRAAESGFDYFATTLTVSPHKDANLINEAGLAAQKKYGSEYLVSDFKKKDGYLRSLKLSEVYGLYRQSYCGCLFTDPAPQSLAAELKEK